MASLDVEGGKNQSTNELLKHSKQPSAWVEDEVQELSLSSSSVSSSDDRGKQRRPSRLKDSRNSTVTLSPSAASVKGYPQVVIRGAPGQDTVNFDERIEKTASSETSKSASPISTLRNVGHIRSRAKASDSDYGNMSPSGETTKKSRTDDDKNPQIAKEESRPEGVSLSSHRMSAGDSSPDGTRSITSQSQSETRSYRDRLKDRFQTVKERAGIRRETKARRNVSEYLSNQIASHIQVDELIRKEERELEAALEKHHTTFNRQHPVLSEGFEEDVSVDFFTRVWDLETTAVTLPGQAVSQQEDNTTPPSSDSRRDRNNDEELLDVNGGDKSKLLAADYLDLGRDDLEDVDHSIGPMLWGNFESSVKESELYFYPSNSPVALEDRLGPDQVVRYREEEGLFVGRPPKVRSANRHRLEKRLLEQRGRHWFGDDGEVNILPDPLRTAPYRPPSCQKNSLLDVEYVAGLKPHIHQDNVVSEGASCALLEIHIGVLNFQHHPLFSQEHVLAQKMLNLFHQYSVREALQHEERLAGRLDSLRQAYDNLQVVLNANAADVTPHQLDRLQMYKKEIRATWRNLLSESYKGRQLLLSLLANWRDLKKLRDIQGYLCTPYRLIIHREQLSQSEILAEKVNWEREIRQACHEMEMEEQERYSLEWEQYQAQLEAWRKQSNVLTGKVSEVKEEPSPTSDADQATENHTSNERNLQMTPGVHVVLEPQEPNPVDSRKIQEHILEKISQCLRPPGEPKIKLSIKESEKPEEDPQDMREKQRRNALKRCKLFIRVFYNKKVVCKTQSYHLNSKFKIALNECFSIRILQPPDSIHLAVFEDGAGGGRHLLAQVFLPVPPASKTLNLAAMEHHEFSSERIVSFSHAGVGSGTFISGSPSLSGCLYTSGTVSCRIGWGTDKKTNMILSPPLKYLPPNNSEQESSDLLAELGNEGTLDVVKLTEWVEKSQLDPNDPSNASFFFLIKNLHANAKRDPDFFRLNPLLMDFDFCDDTFLDKNPRLRMLMLRAQGESEFRDWKLVPLREKEIPEEVFQTYEKRLSNARETELDVDSSWSDPLSSHRAWGQLYLERVYQRVLAQCRQAQRTANFHHIIAEDQVPDISTLGLTFMKWLQPKRPLRPLRKERKKVAVQSLGGQEVRLMVSVIRAFEVPVRKTTDSLLGSVLTPSTTNLGFATVAVRPFVEVSFQGSSLRTTTAEGANPTWNQDLQIPVRPGNSESDTLFIHLFDEVVVDLVEDDRQRETSIHQRLERNWLASLNIPFTTLVHNARIEGTFKMYSPPMLLGYERESHQRAGWQSGTLSLDQGAQLFPNRDATFINLFITVQPALNPPEPFNERLDSGEVLVLEEHLLHFEREIDMVVPHRHIKTLVIDASGKSVCISRFFRPLMPPALLNEDIITEDAAARFVSMVPVAPSQRIFDVWLTCDQVLRLGWGDAWAHAVLLCCYLLGLGKKAWLLIGTGIPHGQTAYVLVCEKQGKQEANFWVWDPTAGQRYSIFDSFCPLQRVYGLVNDENIWINLQKEELPWRTQFDLSRRSDWAAAFGGRGSVSAPVGSVQPTSLRYLQTSTKAATTLQEKLEKYLRESLMKWRRTKTTLWNRYCIATLRKILPRLEHSSSFGSGENGSPHHSKELHHILASHKMCGFPINLPYTTVEAVVEAVHATGVHHNQDENAEFALAVYVHPFPNNILSVWVYVASLSKLR